MSLLPNESYANKSRALWLSAQGGNVTGPIDIQAPGGAIQFLDASGNQISRIVSEVPPIPSPQPGEGLLFLQSDYGVAFSQQNSGAYNTALYIDDFNGEDLLDVGGQVNVKTLGVSSTNGSGMSGFASIPLGSNNVTISTTAIDQGDMIFFTRVGQPAVGPGSGVGQGGLIWRDADIVPQTSFKVQLIDPATGVITSAVTTSADFYWMIVKTIV